MLRQRLKENAAREREEKMRKNIAESEARRDKVEEKNFNENPDGNEINGDSSQNSTLTFKEPSFDKKLNSSPNFGQKNEKSPEKKLKSIDSQGLEEDESNSSSQAPDFGISGKKEEEKFPISPPSNHGSHAKARNSSQLSEYTISNKDAYLVYQSRVDDSNLMSLMNGTIDDDKVHLEWRKIIDDEGNRSHGGLEDRSMINHFRAMKQAPVNPYSSSMIKHYNIASGIGIHSKDRMTEAKSELKAYSANDIILQLLLLGVDKKYNMHITCDYELKECENTFQEMCKRYSYCPEAYFGLGKIYFSKNLTKKALEMFELALKGPKRDTVYCLWAAMTCFYLYIHSEKKEKVTYMKKIEKYCTECLESNIKDTNALFILLMATHDSIENLKSTRFKPSYVPEDIAIRIKEADNYKGYLAWVEIHLHQKDTEFAFQVLDELIEYYPERPESYFKLLHLFEKKSEKA